MMVELEPIFELRLSEKLQLLEDLWDSIAVQPANIPVLDWQKAELTKRREAYLRNTGMASSWDLVKARIRDRSNG